MNKWLLWLALCSGALACTVEPIADSSEDEGGEDESDDGSDDDDDHMAHVDAGSKMDAGKKDASTSKDAGKKDAGKKDGAISVPCGDDAGGGAASGGGIGAPCEQDDDCQGDGAKCLRDVALPIGGATLSYPDGYCTIPCTEDAACGDGASCPLGRFASFAPDLSTCMKRCEAADDCRDGYSCSMLPSIPGMAPASSEKSCLPPTPFGGTTFP